MRTTDSCPRVEEVIVDYFFEDQSENGDIVLSAFALDGRIIQLIKPSPKRLERYRKSESDDTKQEDYEDWLRRRGNSPRGRALSNLRRTEPPV